MFKPYEKVSGRQHTRWVAFLLAALLCPIGLFVTAPNSIAVVILTLIVSIVCFRLAWVHWNKHTGLSVPSLNLR
jgi:hypothetical protein